MRVVGTELIIPAPTTTIDGTPVTRTNRFAGAIAACDAPEVGISAPRRNPSEGGSEVHISERTATALQGGGKKNTLKK